MERDKRSRAERPLYARVKGSPEIGLRIRFSGLLRDNGRAIQTNQEDPALHQSSERDHVRELGALRSWRLSLGLDLYLDRRILRQHGHPFVHLFCLRHGPRLNPVHPQNNKRNDLCASLLGIHNRFLYQPTALFLCLCSLSSL
jgi:hypothetical protein